MLIHAPSELAEHLDARRQRGERVGLVPTMGALHEGHLSLVRESMRRCETTVVSIFVNPSQFGPNEDFAKYPRTLEADRALLAQCGECVVFAPPVEAMYPPGFDSQVEVGGVASEFEGAVRPGHFRGVATVVLKLFLMSGAEEAFFGQKDFQQLRLIEHMVADLNVPIRIVSCPTVREADGLAMSSRNRYLSPEHREKATVLFESLILAEKMITDQKIESVDVIRHALRQTITTGTDAVIDYATVADYETVREIDRIDRARLERVVVLLAARFGTTRLIDNMIVPLRSP